MLKRNLKEDPALKPEDVIALASRLRDEHRESVTVDEMEKIGGELGIEPQFVHEAMARLSEATTSEQPILSTPAELRAWASAFSIPVAIAMIAYLVCAPYRHDSATHPEFFAFIMIPLLTAWIPGFITSRKRVGVLAGLWFATCVVFAIEMLYGRAATDSLTSRPEIEMWLDYAVPGTLIGIASAWVRARVKPPCWLSRACARGYPSKGSSGPLQPFSSDEPEQVKL